MMGDSDDIDVGAIKYDHNTNSMRFVVNGSDPTILINSSGYVGIGTEAPTNELEVSGSGTVALFKGTGGNAFIGIQDVDSGNNAYIGNEDGGLVFQTPSSSYSTKMTITHGGNVGIGLTNPTNTLVLKETDPVLEFRRNFGSGTSDIGSINFGNNNIDSDLARITVEGDGATDNAAIVFKTQATGNVVRERLRIDSSGNVGIGTDDTSLYNNTSGNGIMMRGGQVIDIARDNDLQLTLNRLTADGANIGLYQGGALKGTIGTKSGGIYFGTGGDTERLHINSTGAVVIRHNGATASDGYAGLEVRAAKDKYQLVLASSSAVAGDNRATLGFKVSQSGQEERVKAAIIVEGTGDAYGEVDYMSFCLDAVADNGNADTTADEKLRITSDGQVHLVMEVLLLILIVFVQIVVLWRLVLRALSSLEPQQMKDFASTQVVDWELVMLLLVIIGQRLMM